MSPKKDAPLPKPSNKSKSDNDSPVFGQANNALPSVFARIATKAVYDKRLNHSTLLVLLAIGVYANNQGIAWPNATTLAKVARCSTKTVSNAKTKLRKYGYIREISKYRSRFPRIMGSVWRIIFDERIPDDQLIDSWINEDDTGIAIEKDDPETFLSKHSEDQIPSELVEEAGGLARWFAKNVAEKTGEIRTIDDQAMREAARLLKSGRSGDQIRTAAFTLLHERMQAGQPAPRDLGNCGIGE